MREIKFRGKDIMDDHWVYGDLHVLCDRPHIHIEPSAYPYAGKRSFVDPATVGQFTGLLDKNGTPIYEGDIVEHPYIDPIFGDLVEMKDGKGVKSVVVFHEGAFCVRYGEDVFYYLDQFTRHKHIEVVGNIHDNPDLIEKGGEEWNKQ